MRGPRYLPDPRHWMIADALIGGTAGVASGAISDIKRGNTAEWLIRGLAGSFAGGSLGLASAVAIVLVQTPSALLRRNKLIFEENAPSSPTTAADEGI